MQRVSLIALRPHRYGGRRLITGQVFDATPKHAKLLKAIKRATDAPANDYDYLKNYTSRLPNEKPDPPVPNPTQDDPSASESVVTESGDPVPSVPLIFETAEMEVEPEPEIAEPLSTKPKPKRPYRRKTATSSE